MMAIAADLGEIQEDAPFKSARKAIKFALLFEGKPTQWNWGQGRALDSHALAELAGYDGSAQAGMVLQAIGGIGALPKAVLRISVLPQRIRCTCRQPCCRGNRPNFDWIAAAHIVRAAARRELVAVTLTDEALVMLISRVYGGKNGYTLKRIAEKFNESDDAVTRHSRQIARWLLGDHKDGFEGVESMAWRVAEDRLRLQGIVGDG